MKVILLGWDVMVESFIWRLVYWWWGGSYCYVFFMLFLGVEWY